jgi:hypothetical protein
VIYPYAGVNVEEKQGWLNDTKIQLVENCICTNCRACYDGAAVDL